MSVKYAPSKLRVPDGFQYLLEGLAREILREQPDNIIQFADKYFKDKLEERATGGSIIVNNDDEIKPNESTENDDVQVEPNSELSKVREEEAAIKIQSVIRGAKARKEVNEIKASMSTIINNEGDGANVPPSDESNNISGADDIIHSSESNLKETDEIVLENKGEEVVVATNEEGNISESVDIESGEIAKEDDNTKVTFDDEPVKTESSNKIEDATSDAETTDKKTEGSNETDATTVADTIDTKAENDNEIDATTDKKTESNNEADATTDADITDTKEESNNEVDETTDKTTESSETDTTTDADTTDADTTDTKADSNNEIDATTDKKTESNNETDTTTDAETTDTKTESSTDAETTDSKTDVETTDANTDSDETKKEVDNEKTDVGKIDNENSDSKDETGS